MRLRTLLALVVVLVLGSAGAAAAQTPGTAELIVINEVTGFGPVSVSVTDASGVEVGNIGIVEEFGDPRITLPAGAGYVVSVAAPETLGEPLAATGPIELFAGSRHVVIAIPQDGGIGFDTYQTDPIQGGNVRVVNATGRSETLNVNLRNGDADVERNFDVPPGALVDLTDLPNGRYGVDISSLDGPGTAAIDNLLVAAGQWTVLTIVADGSGIDVRVTGPGPLPSPSPVATPSPSPSPTAIRTPTRIETGGGGAATPSAGAAFPAVSTLALLAAAAATISRRQKNQAPEV